MTTANQRFRTSWYTKLAMPVSGGTTRSQEFQVPQGAKTVTIVTPNLATSTSLVLAVLTPDDVVEATQTWVPLKVFNLTDGSLLALDGFDESSAITLPVSALGGGMLSFTAADDQSGAPTTIYLIWTRDG